MYNYTCSIVSKSRCSMCWSLILANAVSNQAIGTSTKWIIARTRFDLERDELLNLLTNAECLLKMKISQFTLASFLSERCMALTYSRRCQSQEHELILYIADRSTPNVIIVNFTASVHLPFMYVLFCLLLKTNSWSNYLWDHESKLIIPRHFFLCLSTASVRFLV